MPTPSAPMPAPRTYASMVFGIPVPVIPLKPILKFKGCLMITFSSEDIQALAVPYQFTLVGTFWYERSFMAQIKAAVDRIGFQRSIKLGLLDSSHILLHFDQEPDYLMCFSRQSWTLAWHHMCVIKWTADHDPKVEVPIVPVWVALPGLSVHFHHKETLFQIARMFGEPIKLDAATSGSFARLLRVHVLK